MKIYVCHSRNFDFQKDLYQPLKDSHLPIDFIFPHEESSAPFKSKELFKLKECEYVLAEVSYPATGQGIELGWADAFEVPIIAFYKAGTKPADSLRVITDNIIEYNDPDDLVGKLTINLKLNIA